MFNLNGSEIVFLLLLALIVLGPEKLPDAVRRFGKAYGEFKKMSTGFQSELKSALDEPMREMRETADAFKKAASFDFDADDDASPATKGDAVEDVAPATPAGDAPTDSSATDSSATDSTATGDAPTDSAATDSTATGNEPPLTRPPGPTFHSAAPQQPKVVEAVEEPASE